MQRDTTAVAATPGAAFKEGYVDADGFHIRYLEAGQGTPLIHLHGAGGLFLSPAHDLLCQHHRVIAFEMPGFGHSPVNNQETIAELAATMAQAITNLGIDTFNLWGTSFGGKAALALAMQVPERVLALVLEAPAAIRKEGGAPPPANDPEAMMRAFHAHPERFTSAPTPDPEIQAKTWPMVLRLIGPDRDAAFEEQLKTLTVPVLVLFGTLDGIISPDMASIYPTLIPKCHLVWVYDAAHALTDDRPEAFTEIVHDFLERHVEFVVSQASTVIHP